MRTYTQMKPLEEHRDGLEEIGVLVSSYETAIKVRAKEAVWQFALKMRHAPNPPSRDTQISRYLAVHIQTAILI